MKISVTIISRDKNKILPQCFATAGQVSDDVVIVDNTDHKFVNYSDQKNYAAALCKHDWILSLDDDEWLSPELIDELQTINDEQYTAYKIPRLNYIFGKAIYHTNWGPDVDRHVWLYDRKSCEWVGSVHEEIKTKRKIGRLKGFKIHQNYTTVEQFMNKLNDYTSRETTAVNPAFDFIRRYIWHRGFLDGWHGLFLSYLMMIYHIVVWVKKKSSSS
ncbi:MAG: glycosyltransferase family 2 protein [Patescibacteria group bacterium]